MHPGTPTMVDTIVAGVGVRAEWVGTAPTTGKIVDVELDIEPVLRWMVDSRQWCRTGLADSAHAEGNIAG